jgi:uncharacterized repeat protein (TIGR01451 family)
MFSLGTLNFEGLCPTFLYLQEQSKLMKRLFSTTFALTALATTILVGASLPIISQFTQPAVAQTATAPKPLVLKLSQSKKVADKKGFKLVPITKAVPGDVIVYKIAANNISTKPINKLVINQKIRPGTTYVLSSATPIKGAELTFSTDGGKTYTTTPLVAKKPAPASNYTNVRWAFVSSIAPKSQSDLSYEVKVR